MKDIMENMVARELGVDNSDLKPLKDYYYIDSKYNEFIKEKMNCTDKELAKNHGTFAINFYDKAVDINDYVYIENVVDITVHDALVMYSDKYIDNYFSQRLLNLLKLFAMHSAIGLLFAILLDKSVFVSYMIIATISAFGIELVCLLNRLINMNSLRRIIQARCIPIPKCKLEALVPILLLIYSLFGYQIADLLVYGYSINIVTVCVNTGFLELIYLFGLKNPRVLL